MLVALCPKCRFPVWFGKALETALKATCQMCELESDVDLCDKIDQNEWREKVMGNDKDYAIARNAFYMNFIAVADKMDLPTFLAEWRLLTQDDTDLKGGDDVGRILREEFKCLAKRILERLNERMSSVS